MIGRRDGLLMVVQLSINFTNHLSRPGILRNKAATLAYVLPKCIYGQQWKHENPAYPMPREFFAGVISGEARVSVSGHIYGCTKGEAIMIMQRRKYSFDNPLLNDVALVFLYILQ